MHTLILAGGRATRLGGVDKPLLLVAGRPLLAHILDTLAGPVAISANGDPARYEPFGLEILADTIADRGPLGGVLAGLEWAASLGAPALLTIPGDTPFVPPGLGARLGAAPAWAENAAGLHPLIAAWPTDCAAALRAWLEDNASGRVRGFGQSIGMRPVWFADIPDPFLNINTPTDLDEAARRQDVCS